MILIGSVGPKGNEPGLGKITDREMLVMPGGRERSEQDSATSSIAGFTLTRMIPTNSPLSVVMAEGEDVEARDLVNCAS